MSGAFASWALLELMGHRQVPGFVEEVEVASAKFFRVRVPSLLVGEDRIPKLILERPVLEQFYSPSSVYALTPTTERAVAKLVERELRYTSLPQLPPPGMPDNGCPEVVNQATGEECGKPPVFRSEYCASHGGGSDEDPTPAPDEALDDEDLETPE